MHGVIKELFQEKGKNMAMLPTGDLDLVAERQLATYQSILFDEFLV